MNFKGGRVIQLGYVLIHTPSHPNASHGGYVREHRLVRDRNGKFKKGAA